MRHIIAIFVCLVLLKSELFSQLDSTTVLKDSVRTVMLVQDDMPRSTQVMLLYGVSPLPFAALNEIVRSSRYGGSEEFAPTALEGFSYSSFETQSVYEKWRFLLNAYAQGESIRREGRPYANSTQGREVNIGFSRIGVEFGAGYTVYKNRGFSLYPFALIGSEINVLSVEEGSKNIFANSFQDNFNDSSIVSNSFLSAGFSIQGGVGADINVYTLFKDDYTKQPLGIMLGVRASYMAGLFASSWSSRGYEIPGGPDIGTNGFRLSAGFGIAVLPRIFKAKIISEEK